MFVYGILLQKYIYSERTKQEGMGEYKRREIRSLDERASIELKKNRWREIRWKLCGAFGCRRADALGSYWYMREELL